MREAIMSELAARNGGPGLTARELASFLHAPEAIVRNMLAALVFREKCVTCDARGRFSIGEPSALLAAGPMPLGA
jgi:DNA-binding IclR family transcriptional regulator